MIRKFHPDLRVHSQGLKEFNIELTGEESEKENETAVIQLGDEERMKELWDASNPDMPHEMRSNDSWKYPVENWFGVIVNEKGKGRLVTIVGNAVREGKNSQPYAYFGGGETHPDYRGKRLFRGGVREKALDPIRGMPRIAGFTNMRQKSGLTLDKPETHEIIPDDVLAFMDERIKHLDTVDDWGVSKWFAIIRGD